MIKVIEADEKLKVYSPYHEDLPLKAKNSGGKWNGECWVYELRNKEFVKEIYLDIYGQFDEPVDLVSISITNKEEIIEYRGGIYFAGRKIASASGRDSGAKIGDHVLKAKGSISSGGSIKNWKTIIRANSQFILHDVPVSMIQPYLDDISEYDEFKIEILSPPKLDKKALKAEKERLLKRIADIEKQLKA